MPSSPAGLPRCPPPTTAAPAGRPPGLLLPGDTDGAAAAAAARGAPPAAPTGSRRCRPGRRLARRPLLTQPCCSYRLRIAFEKGKGRAGCVWEAGARLRGGSGSGGSAGGGGGRQHHCAWPESLAPGRSHRHAMPHNRRARRTPAAGSEGERGGRHQAVSIARLPGNAGAALASEPEGSREGGALAR